MARRLLARINYKRKREDEHRKRDAWLAENNIWYTAYDKDSEEANTLLTDITFKILSKERVCERCGDTFSYFYMAAPDDTELYGIVKENHPKFILTTVCGPKCLTLKEQEVCDGHIPNLDVFNTDGLSGLEVKFKGRSE